MSESLERGLAQVGEARRRDDLLAPTLTEFLLERIDMPEAMSPEAIWLRRRVLADCRAKRRIVYFAEAAQEEPHGSFYPPRVHMTGLADGFMLALRALAAVYADHRDFREEWRP